jgi:hypothetical protein
LKQLGCRLSRLVREPYIVIAPANRAYLTHGPDGVFRFTQYQVMVVLMTDEHVYAYRCIWHFLYATRGMFEAHTFRHNGAISALTRYPQREADGSTITVMTHRGMDHVNFHVFDLLMQGGQRITVPYGFSATQGGRMLLQPSAVAATVRLLRSTI